METTSKIRQALYRGDRVAADDLASPGSIDVFEAAALGDAAALRDLLVEDPSRALAFADDGFTALQLAAFLGDAESVRVLVDAGADVNAAARNEMKVQPLHAAAARPAGVDIEACRALLEASADPNGRQQGGHTPIDEAIVRKNDELAALLIAYGAHEPT